MSNRPVTTDRATIRRLRKERGWSQVALAKRAGIHFSVVSRIESGDAQGSASSIRKIADAFGVTVGDITIGDLADVA